MVAVGRTHGFLAAKTSDDVITNARILREWAKRENVHLGEVLFIESHSKNTAFSDLLSDVVFGDTVLIPARSHLSTVRRERLQKLAYVRTATAPFELFTIAMPEKGNR